MFCVHRSGGTDGASLPCAFGARFLLAGLTAAGLAAVLLATASPALADSKSRKVTELNSPTIYVESDGNKYTTTQPAAPIQGEIEIHIDTEVSGRIEYWSGWPVLGYQDKNGSEAWGNFKTSGADKGYSSPRPKEVTEKFNFLITSAYYASTMVNACNAHAEKLKLQGQTTTQILSGNRWIEVAVDARLEIEVTGPGEALTEVQTWGSFKKVNVICLASESLDPPQNPITGAYLTAEGVDTITVGGACKLKLSGGLISQHPNTEVKFFYVDEKGKKSDLKTVNTGADSNVNFKHDYPLPSGHHSGKIRMVGQSHAFFSNWSDFDVDCAKPGPQGEATLLPPLPFHLEAIAKADSVMYRGMICPSKVAIWGIVKGRGPAQGHIVLAQGNTPRAMEPYDIKDDEQVIVQAEHNLDWEGAQTAQQNIQYAMYVTNKNGDVLDQKLVSQNFVCRKPEVADAHQGRPGGMTADVETPKSTALSVTELGKKAQNGYVCPVKGRVLAQIQTGTKGFSGKIVIYAGGSVKQQYDIDLPANYTTFYPYDYELPWDDTTIPGQAVAFAMKVLNQHGFEVASEDKIEAFACTEIKTTGIAQIGGGMTTAPKDPLPSQQGRPAASTQLAVGPAMAILSPKGTVRKGEIRLTGGPANATYELTFYRKVYSSYQPVNIAGLPKQMTGLTASFDLARLDSARQWRLEVCPVMGGQGTCKTSDFRVPLIGTKKQQAPAQGTPLIIVPGALGQN